MSEPVLPPSGVATVVLDIGAGTGALVLHTPATMENDEIDISRTGSATRTHSQVRQRHIGGNVMFAAVYPGLDAGEYTLWRPDGSAALTVTITGGEVTTCHWPA